MSELQSPPAYGVRAEWPTLPHQLRAAVESHLGAPIVSAVNQPGGFSPGAAVRIRCANGRRAFCKAVGEPLNDVAVRLYRREARVAAALPARAPVARLRFVYDETIEGAAWIALVFDEIDGAMPPTPWRSEDIDLIVAALDDMADTLTPCPIPDADRAGAFLAEQTRSWSALAARGAAADLDPWELRHLDRLIALSEGTLERLDGDTAVHYDVRADNLLVTRDRRVYVVDWPHAFVGARWLDVAGFAINIALYGGDPDAVLARSRVVSTAPEADVTGFLAGVCGLFAERSRAAPPPGLPTVRDFQRAQELAMLPWLARRTGWT